MSVYYQFKKKSSTNFSFLYLQIFIKFILTRSLILILLGKLQFFQRLPLNSLAYIYRQCWLLYLRMNILGFLEYSLISSHKEHRKISFQVCCSVGYEGIAYCMGFIKTVSCKLHNFLPNRMDFTWLYCIGWYLYLLSRGI